jgi:cysteinyl-tRNA synthetase
VPLDQKSIEAIPGPLAPGKTMPLHLYNTLTRKKQLFTPIDDKNVRMYVCGPTVYDFAHIGNARPVIVFDVLYRLLRHLYGPDQVKYVRNITDVDDKINARALRDFPDLPLNEAIRKVTEKTASQFQADAKALGCLGPTDEPRATEHIAGMVEMISTLITKGFAYEADSEVLFDVAAMPEYGRLSQRKLEDQQAGARVAVDAHKKNPADFVLWKLSAADEPGWESPWGRGRPGWHIECSAMSKKHLGEIFDIHGGGLDLIFPHHENEIAQSRCAHGTGVMANYWMHNGFLQVEGQKMSKSLGNFRTIADELGKKDGRVLRLAMLMTHYRQPIDWSNDRLAEASSKLGTLRNSVRMAVPERGKILPAVLEALEDDLNIHEAIRKLETSYSAEKNDLAFTLVLLGLMDSGDINFELGREQFSGIRKSVKGAMETIENRELLFLGLDREVIVNLINDRLLARFKKDWKKSDRIRDELAAMGVSIKDNKDGTTSWEVKR